MDPQTKEELDIHLQKCRALLVSADWSVWVNFLKKERKGYLQQKVNEAVKDEKLVQAQIMLALLNDCDRQIELFGRYIKNTESTKEKMQ